MKNKNETLAYSEMEMFLDKMAKKSLKLEQAQGNEIFKFGMYLFFYFGIIYAFFYFDNTFLKVALGVSAFLLTLFTGVIVYVGIKTTNQINKKDFVFLLISSCLTNYTAHIGNVRILGEALKIKNFVFNEEELLEFTRLVINVFGEETTKRLLEKTLVGGEYSLYDAVRLHCGYKFDFSQYNKKVQEKRAGLIAESLVSKASQEK